MRSRVAPALAWLAGMHVVLAVVPRTAAACDRLVTLDRAEFEFGPLRGDPPAPPSLARARGVVPEVELPDRVGRRLSGKSGVAFYRLLVPRTSSGVLCGLLLRHVHANAVVYLNGEWLGQGGRFSPPSALVWNRPLYFAFPAARLTREVNVLDVGVLAHGGAFTALDEVILGPRAEVAELHRRALLLRTAPAELGTVLSVGVVLLFAAFGFSLREPVYLWLSLAAAFHGVNSLNFHLRDLPVPFWVFNTVVNAAIDLMGCALAALVLRLLGLRWRWASRGLWAFAAVVVLMALVSSGPEFERRSLILHLPAASICLWALSLLYVFRARLPPLERGIYLVTGLVMITITARDLWIQVQKQFGAIDADVVHGFPLLGPVILLGFGSALLARFLRVYRRAEHANVELQQQIEEKHAELERNFERVRQAEHEAVLAKERERVMDEMHDGIGGHLVAALAMIDDVQNTPKDIARALREALDDMRLVIHSLQPSASDIPLMLADMRARLEPRLSSQGLRFQWAVQDLPGLELSPGEVLQVLRIVQESVTNVIKHAAARCVSVSTGIASEHGEPHAFVEIADDGQGMNGGKREGRGLPNMRARAQRLGGQVSVTSRPSGTSVRLSIPMERG